MEPEVHDFELLYMYRQREDIALVLLIKKYDTKIRNIIFHYLGFTNRYQDMDELYQNALIKLLQAIDTYREDKQTSFSHFYLEIVKHSVVDSLRGRNRKKYTQIHPLNFEAHEEKGVYLQKPSYFEQSSDLGYGEDEIMSRLAKNCKRISALELQILQLRRKGYKYKEIALTLNISTKKVDNTLRKVRYRKD